MRAGFDEMDEVTGDGSTELLDDDLTASSENPEKVSRSRPM
ncbi:hypothetical protein X749_30520 [Mesorhizobium sp. LNJC391B00]|nr:hypothetical protein X749_30520 [Mesorhizobium sp. LNJC391B00]